MSLSKSNDVSIVRQKRELQRVQRLFTECSDGVPAAGFMLQCWLRSLGFELSEYATQQSDMYSELRNVVLKPCNKTLMRSFVITGNWETFRHTKVANGSLTAEQLVLQLGDADIEQEFRHCCKWESSLSELSKAARKGDLDGVKTCVNDDRSELDCIDSLFWACAGGNLHIIEYLIERLLEHVIDQARDSDYCLPPPTKQTIVQRDSLLHKVVAVGSNAVIAKLLWLSGSDVVNETDPKSGMTVLHAATEAGRGGNTMKLLLAAGGDRMTRVSNGLTAAAYIDGCTRFHENKFFEDENIEYG